MRSFSFLNLQILMKLGEILTKLDETSELIMKINDDRSYSLFYKRAFSDVLEGVRSKNLFEEKPPDPHFLPIYLRKKTILRHTCYLSNV